jgi:hypothetical protein
VTQYQPYVVNNAPGERARLLSLHAPPDPNDARDGTLAWLVKRAHPGETLHFSWTDTYAFAWRPDADSTFQLVPADSSTVPATVAKLDRTGSGYALATGVALAGAVPGTLYLEQSTAVPRGVDVGFAMDGACLYSEAATPGGLATFDTAAGYWLVAGTFAQGGAVDVTVATAAQRVQFPTGVTAMTATLDGLNVWHVAPGAPRT